MKYLQKTSIVLLIIIFIATMVVTVFIDRRGNLATVIGEDLKNLKHAFQKIHADCEILGFDHVKNPITFLNVIKFSGSEVGSMNLVHPELWHGPYLKENPTISGTEYQLVRAHDGYFIIPGDNVQLPNGKVVGKDVVLDTETELAPALLDQQRLRYKDMPLGVKIVFESALQKGLETLPAEYMDE